MKKGIEVWTDYDKAGQWCLRIKKAKGKFTLDEIIETCREYENDFYMISIKAMDEELGQYYDIDDFEGDYVTVYRADDFFEWRQK
jgi:hypothetical protein